MDSEDEDGEENLRETRKVLISPKDLRDLLERAYNYGVSATSGFPAYLPPLGRWERTRDGWIDSRLECTHKLRDCYFQCQVLGIHTVHGARMGSPLVWVSWDDNRMTPGQPDLPAGYERWYYEEHKEEIDKRLAKLGDL